MPVQCAVYTMQCAVYTMQCADTVADGCTLHTGPPAAPAAAAGFSSCEDVKSKKTDLCLCHLLERLPLLFQYTLQIGCSQLRVKTDDSLMMKVLMCMMMLVVVMMVMIMMMMMMKMMMRRRMMMVM